MREFIEISTISNRRSSSTSIANDILQIYNVTVTRQRIDQIKHELGFDFSFPLPSVALTPSSKFSRIRWCCNKVNWEKEWEKIVFSYESYFQITANSSN